MNRALIHTLFATLVVIGGITIKTPQAYAQHGTVPGTSAPSPATASPAAPAAGEASKMAEQAFKNIQVLKGTPAEQLQPAMQFISSALGVECEFCHVAKEFEKDDKKSKQTARKMIEMQMAINRDHFKGQREVTCYSCHRGAHDPIAVPVITEEEPRRPEAPKAEAAPPALPAGSQILDKYLDAVGGAEALKKITTRIQRGTISFAGRKAPLQVMAKAPNKRATAVTTQEGVNITAYDGQSGWTGVPGGRRPQDMTRAEAEAFALDATFYFPIEVQKMFAQTRVRPSEKIGDQEVIQVIGLREGRPPLRLFFDQQSGLLLRMVHYAETPLGRNPTQIDYADYREDSGVKIPFRWSVSRPQGRFTIQIDSVRQNVAIDDERFSKPETMTKTIQ